MASTSSSVKPSRRSASASSGISAAVSSSCCRRCRQNRCQADDLHAAHLLEVCRVLCQPLHRAAAELRMCRVCVHKGSAVIQPRNAAFFCQCTDHLVGQVAVVGRQRTAVGVACRKGAGAVVYDIPEALSERWLTSAVMCSFSISSKKAKPRSVRPVSVLATSGPPGFALGAASSLG